MIELLTISSGVEACGIREYANHLQANLPGDITMRGNGRGEWLDPTVFFGELPDIQQYQGPQVVWLNYHAALHSRWNPGMVERLRQHLPVLVTYHDTSNPVPDQCRTLYHAVVWSAHDQPVHPGRFVVHEPCPELGEAVYLRQGVPGAESPIDYRGYQFKQYSQQPVLGTVGFNFPWKCFDQLCTVTQQAGWAFVLLANNATDEDEARWLRLNPNTYVVRGFHTQAFVVAYLSGCTATAFMYTCANTGTSGAIRQGIAARRPVYALRSCRQWRDLHEWEQTEGHEYIRWVDTFDALGYRLRTDRVGGIDAGMVYLAQVDSWRTQAEKYATLFRGVSGA